MRPSDSNKILIVALRRKSLPTPDLSNYEYVGHGPPCSRTKIYAARVSRGGSSYRETYAARARPQQQTHRPPLLLSIDGTDRRTDGHSTVLELNSTIYTDPTGPARTLSATRTDPTEFRLKKSPCGSVRVRSGPCRVRVVEFSSYDAYRMLRGPRRSDNRSRGCI